ncbi:hypothetical protein R7X13_03640, partial [Mesomycoplasma ovipneumoniae]|uniref:hypothetical protein n=1 Tax=Mesomycoplasma ovipneumoniae TaxID=29562 RepID=UPI002964F69D
VIKIIGKKLIVWDFSTYLHEKIFVFHVCIYIDKRNLILRVKIIMNILIFQFDGKNSLFSEYKYAKTR